MFLIDMRNASVAPVFITEESSEKSEKLRRFKDFVENHHTVTFFTSPEDLARLVLASLISEFGVIT